MLFFRCWLLGGFSFAMMAPKATTHTNHTHRE